jgi:hypothetical protein
MPNICYIKSIPTLNFGMEIMESSIKRVDRATALGGAQILGAAASTWSNAVLGWEPEWFLLPLRRSQGYNPPKLFHKFNAKYCGMVHSKTTMASETWVKITDSV